MRSGIEPAKSVEILYDCIQDLTVPVLEKNLASIRVVVKIMVPNWVP